MIAASIVQSCTPAEMSSTPGPSAPGRNSGVPSESRRIVSSGFAQPECPEALVPLSREGNVGADPRARGLMILDVRRPEAEVAHRLPPDRPAKGEPRADPLDTLAEPIQRVREHRDVSDVLDRFTLRPDAGADVRAEEGRGHQSISAEREAERLVPLSRPGHRPVADPQIEGVAEVVVDPSQVDRVVECRRGEDERRELKPGIDSEARELDEVTHDLHGLETLDRQPRAGAVDPRVRAPREVGVARLGEQVQPELEGDTLLIPGPDQDELASIVVILADQEPRELGACRLGERPGEPLADQVPPQSLPERTQDPRSRVL